jgi:electron transport complex protein RnfC
MQAMKRPQVERSAADGAALRELPVPPRLFIPLFCGAQDAAHKPIGTRVARGDALIECPDESEFIPISPVDGTIVGKAHATLLSGAAPAIEIAVESSARDDQTMQAQSPLKADSSPASCASVGELLDRLRRSGVWADRRTSPDLLGQLALALRRPVDLVLCDALDADGMQELNGAVLRESGADVVAGLTALARASGAARTWLACDSGARGTDAASAALRRGGRKSIRIMPLPNDYPQADPTLLLFALLGRRLRPGKLPVEQGVLLVDAAAARAIGRAVAGHAMLDVPLAVHDVRRGRVHFARAAVGTPLRFVLEALEIELRDATIRAGAALRDVQVSCDAVIAGGELTVDVGAVSAPINPEPCIRCGWCVSSCPTRIHPAGLLEAAQDDDRALAGRYGIDACIECGICSFVCPSRLPLLEAIRTLRGATAPAPGEA